MNAFLRKLVAASVLLCICQWGAGAWGDLRCVEYDQNTGKCIRWVAAPIQANLIIDGIPGAEVRLETPEKTKTKPLCTLPCRGPHLVPSDPVRMVVSKDGHEDFHFTIGSAQKWTITTTLLQCPRITLEGLPDESNVAVNGKHIGVWPDSFQGTSPEKVIASQLGQTHEDGCDLKAQPYTFEFSHEKYSTWRSELMPVEAGPNPTIVKWEPERKKGTILVLSAVGDARVSVDGKIVGALPAAHSADVTFEIRDVPEGVHTLSLSLPDESGLSHDEVWGDFPNEQPNVVVNEKKTTVVRFLLPPQRTPDENPVDFDANWAQLEEECRSHPRACLALGWARRLGVGGPADNVAASEAFEAACYASDDETVRVQGCTAHRWMVDMGLVQNEGGGRYVCVPRDQWLSDTVTPCVRSHLSRESQAQADPTLNVDHDIQNINVGVALFALGGVGPLERFARGGVGLFSNIGVLIIDIDITAGWASFSRWDSAYSKQSWQDVGTFGFEIGPAWNLAEHWYFLAHLSLDDAIHQNSTDPFLYGGRLAFGWTQSRATRRKLFVDVGAMLQWAQADVLGPTRTDLVNALLSSSDLGTFRKNWQKQLNTSAQFVFAPTLSVGWDFEAL